MQYFFQLLLSRIISGNIRCGYEFSHNKGELYLYDYFFLLGGKYTPFL